MAEVIPVLVGLGVDELSMAPQLIPEAIHTIRATSTDRAEALARDVLGEDDVRGIRRLLAEFRRQSG
jgi:phosphotransferase system enzyme I (PtsI)